MQQINQRQHISALDSLRGYASLTVVLHHYSAVFPATIEKHKILGLYNYVTTGKQAVILFFILSGYVLSLSMKNKINYFQFVVRRVFRIYPLYFVVVLVLLLLFHISSYGVLLRYMGADSFSITIDSKFIINTLSLITSVIYPYSNSNGVENKVAFPFDIVTWSLTYEILVSLFFPFMYYLYLKCRIIQSALLLAIHLISAYLLLVFTQNLLAYIYFYSAFFALGIFIYKNHYFFSKLKLSNIWIFFGFILFAGDANNIILPAMLKMNLLNSDFLTAIGSSILIVLCTNNLSFKKFISLFSHFNIGKVSYSIYLLHLPINWLLFYIFMDLLNLKVYGFTAFVVKFLAIILLIILSNITYKYIEKPFIKLSKVII